MELLWEKLWFTHSINVSDGKEAFSGVDVEGTDGYIQFGLLVSN